MVSLSRLRSLAGLVAGSVLVFPAFFGLSAQAVAGETATSEPVPRLLLAETGSAEKSAFESARELGTAEAWKAFLTAYPSGFYADLAKAYVKKLSDAAPATAASAPAQPVSTEVVPATTANGGTHEISCGERGRITSRDSDVKAKVTFSNRSGMFRAIQWIGFQGEMKTYASLNPGQDVTLDTFVTHPWMITDGPGNCVHIILPAAGATQVTLGAAGPYIDPPKPAASRAEDPQPRKVVTKKRENTITCSAGKTWNGKQCVGNPYVDKSGRPMDGYYADKQGNIHQDNGGGE